MIELGGKPPRGTVRESERAKERGESPRDTQRDRERLCVDVRARISTAPQIRLPG